LEEENKNWREETHSHHRRETIAGRYLRNGREGEKKCLFERKREKGRF
jgi:hypothetical protein